jgi:mono/diheme cytochrome c family protein
MGMTNRFGIAFACAAVLGSTGCTRIDDALASVPFFAFMRSSPAVDPYEATRPAPPGTVPFESPAGEYIPPIASAAIGPSMVGTEVGLRAFADGPYGQNPFAGEDLTELGREQYTRNCMVCHGTTGLGDGPATGPNKYPAGLARNLTLPASVGLPDGYIYGVIRAGRGLMPPYGTRINHRERWAIVEYVRELQRQAGALPAGGQAANPTGGE